MSHNVPAVYEVASPL